MQISSGSRIGPYSVTGTLGAGGMGNVYRATDSRLGRDVAIKALPEDLARNPQALARFEREARFLAQLNHPNIAAIYGIEELEGEGLLVLELVPGDTLDEIIARGPLSVDNTLRYATEIAAALEAAHEAGIVHRDLKPSNVKITPAGRVKLLDFGIAKLDTADAGGARADEPTQLTRAGSVMGTPGYMSPEQLTNGEVDRRTDVWALGCLLYEMLTAKRAFDGANFIALADAIRNTDPDWSALPRATPEPLRRLIARCLKKDPRDRLHDIGDARVELDELRAEHGGAGSPVARALSRRRVWEIGAAALVVAAFIAWRAASARDDGPIAPPRLSQLTSDAGVEQFPAWSPDGSAIVYAGDAGEVSGTAAAPKGVARVRKLFVRTIGSADVRQITTGEFDDIQPAWFPDGQHIAFVRAREAKVRIEPGDVFGNYELGDVWVKDLTTGRESRLLENAFYPAISPDGRLIAFDASWAGPRRIWVADIRGSNPQQLTGDSSQAATHIIPRWSPDGKKLVYQRTERTKFDVAIVDVASHVSVMVTNDIAREMNPVWGADGKSLYFSSDRGGGVNVWRLAIKRDGTPAGVPHQLTLGAGQDVQIAMSSDGARLAYTTLRQNADLWRVAVGADFKAKGPPQALVGTTTEDSRGAWSPDGKWIAFNSDRGKAGDMNIWVQSLADGASRQVTRGAGGDYQAQWSPNGKELVFFSSREGNADIWKVDVASGALTQLTHGHSLDINPFWSPDGSEIVYQSDSSGRLELWVVRADGGGSQPRQLTNVGVMGHFNRWQPDGYVYFRNPSGNVMMRIPGKGGEPAVVSKNVGSHTSFSPDGSRWVDVTGHKVLWIYSLAGEGQKLFAFDDPEVRIDYPVLSPDGRWLLFDRFRPEGGDIWLAEGIR